ncbi:hypothetical protein [Streptomyces mirabilis]|uniref:hypothetical protein n=1 Tax=Streptomyces mirabilis TaxID=68239 RepID=UPI0036D7945D
MTRTGFYPQEERDSSVQEGPTRALVRSSYGVWWSSGRRRGFPGLREARIERLAAQNPDLKDRVTDRDATIGELTEFKKLALSPARGPARRDHALTRSAVVPEPAPPADPAAVPHARTTVIGTCS